MFTRSHRRLIGLAMAALAWAGVAHAGSKVSLDKASVEQLASLDHVGPSLAEQIVTLRDQRGGHLTSVEELRVLPEITESSLSSLRRNTDVELSVTTASGKTYNSVAEVLQEFDGEPSVTMVQSWANEYARTSPQMVRGILADARGFAALPRVSVVYGYDDLRQFRFDYQEDDAGDLTQINDYADRDNNDRFRLSVAWDLSELVMSSDRIRIIKSAQDAVKLRDRIQDRVTKLFFDRRRHQVEMLLNPRRTLDGQVEDQLRLLELTAGIDSLTGGEFSRAMRGSQPAK